MKNILILQQKGGCGKSTVALELVRSLQRTQTPSCFYDLDQQTNRLQPYKDKKAVVAVIDTPGSLTERMPDWVKESDVIIVPSISSAFDLDPLKRTMDIVMQHKKRKAKVFILLNQYTRWKSSQDYMELLRQMYPDIEILTLPHSELFRQASGAMQSVVEYRPKSTASVATLALVNRIRETVDLPPE